jgi:hypothetical protein
MARPHLIRLAPDILRAAAELALARWRLGARPVRELLAEASRPPFEAGLAPDIVVAKVGRVAWVVPRVAARVPWRADCFVQALAARRWLARGGIASELFIGVRKDRAPEFEAHAWLLHGGAPVTGGDFSGFTPLVTAGPRYVA